jgi:kynurenine formamidase
MSHPPLLRIHRLWDLSQPIYHDGPAWAEYDPPVIQHNYRRAAEAVATGDASRT